MFITFQNGIQYKELIKANTQKSMVEKKHYNDTQLLRLPSGEEY